MSDLARIVDSLPNSADKLQTLNEIRTCLVSENQITLRQTVGNISFNVIFDVLLESQDKEILEVGCVVLDGLLSACEPFTLVHNFHNHLLHGLSVPEKRVQLLCLKQINSACQSSPQQLAGYKQLVSKLVLIVGEKDLSVAKYAMEILSVLGGTTEGLDCLFKGDCFSKFQDVLEAGDEIKFRVFQIVIDISKKSRESLQACEQCGMMQKLLNEIQSPDILIQLNAIELLCGLACTGQGLLYLDQKGVIPKLDEMLQSVHTNPLANFLVPGLLKFFGHIAQQQPEEINGRLRPFINTVFENIHSHDLTVKMIAVETLGHVGALPDGKKALVKYEGQMNLACREIGHIMKSAETDQRARIIDAVSSLLHLRVCDQTEELLCKTEQWFHNLMADPLDFIIKQCQQPFLQLRCAAFTFIRILANQLWGQQKLNNFGGFHEYALNRSTESSKEGKDGKFEVIKTLVESPTAADVFGRVYFLKLRQYYNEGPYFVQAESSVAFEEGT